MSWLKYASHPMSLRPSSFRCASPLSLRQRGTDEGSKVSPVEEVAFCRSHASASLHAHTHVQTHRVQHVLGEERERKGRGGVSQLGAITGAVSKHTQVSIHEHACSPVDDGSSSEWRPATSDPFCVRPNHHQHTLNCIHNHHQRPPRLTQVSLLPITRHFDECLVCCVFEHAHASESLGLLFAADPSHPTAVSHFCPGLNHLKLYSTSPFFTVKATISIWCNFFFQIYF